MRRQRLMYWSSNLLILPPVIRTSIAHGLEGCNLDFFGKVCYNVSISLILGAEDED